MLWFWFVPAVTLVQGQTLDSLLHSTRLACRPCTVLRRAINRTWVRAQCWIHRSRRRGIMAHQGYDATMLRRRCAHLGGLGGSRACQGLTGRPGGGRKRIGLDKVPSSASLRTGCQADYLLMATATPKDQRLTDTWPIPGYSGQGTSRSARMMSIKARLNKPGYSKTVVYSRHHHAAGDRLAAHFVRLGHQC